MAPEDPDEVDVMLKGCTVAGVDYLAIPELLVMLDEAESKGMLHEAVAGLHAKFDARMPS